MAWALVCLSVSAFAAADMERVRVSGQSNPGEFNCPPSRVRPPATHPRTATTGAAFEEPPVLGHATAGQGNSYPAGLKVGLWGDSHTASGTFTDSLLEALRVPRMLAYPSFIAPTFGLKGVRQALHRACVSDDWQLALAYRTVAEGPEKYTKSMAAIRTEVAGGFVWLDFRFPEPSTRVKWADIHFSKDHADRSLLLGITVDDGAETTVNLGASSSHRLRVESDRPYATLRVRVIAGQMSIDGIAPMYEGKVQTILDVYSIPGATAKGWRVVDTAYLRQEDPLGMGYDVVILQSGTNESLDPDFKAALYDAQLNASVMRLKKAYPRARCILVGPPDSQRATGTVRLINDSQQRLASAHSCSHWNWQKAMGGSGAAARWQAKGWMQADLLHLTPAGYEQSARSLASAVPIKLR